MLSRIVSSVVWFAAAAGVAGRTIAAPLPLDLSSPPARLSETGLFTDLQPLTTRPELKPYDINLPFWSDGATKRRWIAVPPGASISFSRDSEWSFPAGTVFVKHFEFPAEGPAAIRRLETRVLVCGTAGTVTGASYRWRRDGSDADLVRVGHFAETSREREDQRKQDAHDDVRAWYFPGVEDCRKCHLPSTGGVLGANTRQLNCECETSDGNRIDQLEHWHRLGLLSGFDLRPEAPLPRLPRLPRADDLAADLETRARAYLDVNCGFCHRPGGAAADFDARFSTTLAEQGLIGTSARINLGRDNAKFVAPRDRWRSMLLVRMEMLGEAGMPPLSHQLVDPAGVALIRDWIESLPGEPTLAPPEITRSSADAASLSVILGHKDPNAVIRYTLDGSTPKQSSATYAKPLVISGPTTVRARAYRPGWNRSIAVHETFVIDR